MKKLLRKGFTLFLAALMIMLMSVQVFAEETVTAYAFEITNVTGTYDLGNDAQILDISDSNSIYKTENQRFYGSFTAKAPVTVKNTYDIEGTFSIFKLIKDGQKYAFESGNEMKDAVAFTSGKVTDYELYGMESIEISSIPNFKDGGSESLFEKGCTITLTEPGYYYLFCFSDAILDPKTVFIKVEGESTATPATEQTPAPAPTEEPTPVPTVEQKPVTEPASVPASSEALSAAPTDSKVLVNGAITSFDAYTINGNNYFKLSDLAQVVNGTNKQFEVTWDGEKNAINLVSNKTYTAVGGEMASGDGKEKSAVMNSSKIYKDGTEVALTAYTINGNNYFKLRDLAQAFDIGVTWDEATSTIGIDTSIGYTMP